MYKKITIIVISLLFLGEIPVEESEPKFTEAEIESFGFVTNSNGIQLYSIAGELKSKTSIMRYQDKFEIYGSYAEEVKGKPWRKVKFRKQDFYILNDEISLQFEDKGSDNYALVQEKSLDLYEKPFKDARVIGVLDQFAIVRPLAIYRLGSDFLNAAESESMQNQLPTWYEITNSKQITGFILNGIGEISDLESVEKYKSKKALNVKGVCELKQSLESFYLDEELTKKPDDRIKGKFHAKSFLSSEYSFEKDKIRYFKVSSTAYSKKTKQELIRENKASEKMKMVMFPAKYNSETFEAYVSEKDCKFYNESEYSAYTARHSKFSGDRRAIVAVKKAYSENYFYLDYTDFKLIPLNPKSSKSDSYFLAVIPEKNLNLPFKYNRGILVVKKNRNYDVVTNSLYPNIDLIDMDKDGVLELIVRVPMRGDTSDNNLFLFHKGNYVSINTILPKHESFSYFQDNEIHVEKNIYDNDGKFVNTKEVKYKYSKGKLSKIK